MPLFPPGTADHSDKLYTVVANVTDPGSVRDSRVTIQVPIFFVRSPSSEAAINKARNVLASQQRLLISISVADATNDQDYASRVFEDGQCR